MIYKYFLHAFSKEERVDNMLRIICYQLVVKGSGFKGNHVVLEPKSLILYIVFCFLNQGLCLICIQFKKYILLFYQIEAVV